MKQENLDPSWMGNGSEEDEIYKENILDHYRSPKNFGKMDESDIMHREFNPVCGDDISFFVVIDDGKVKDVKFYGKGCAISMASASMLGEKIKGMGVKEVKNLSRDDVMSLLGIDLGVVRSKCGLLCLKTIKKGIQKMERKNE
jgi:nitrogen fixation protein NifU and related proteins